MSYALNVAGDALRTLLGLPFDVQEEVWDLLEQIVTEPRRPGAAIGVTGVVHRLRHEAADGSLTLVDVGVIIGDLTGSVFVPRIDHVT